MDRTYQQIVVIVSARVEYKIFERTRPFEGNFSIFRRNAAAVLLNFKTYLYKAFAEDDNTNTLE